ncbi:MAG: UDP-N-acetylglucosamine 1-carboxyvinyltransferase [Candidatus Dojkabacteria bacterium]|uniref:UDP-N-acetylglucosamine 1-carboxyvinyltransferase n=2 Tax=Candidatus Dojkabacteria TaxID=74243 RepID=A0A136KH07_9BACT|nr:MAG: UDP-N-acetylglucosamine 1-carboxyvinyltransferase [candidate division WS6 bacterium OLB21]MBW7953673.1 UDP-N-acetylglucosamine 1-carboxyvinyltransferase [Candidatus Dojkabacteria bacterium]WKZ28085.1 MAG: UDP-N-acetylglucosamine 1-carboxyvinyltransferase [Candidatus Dojkabacteria bacterium]
MSSYIITGGKPLKGRIKPGGNKNAALPIIAASLLTNQKVTLHNVPNISDVAVQLKILKKLGAEVKRNIVNNTVEIEAKNITSHKLSKDDVMKTRGSILFLGALAGRSKEVEMWSPGGCNLGKRPVDSYLVALEKLHAQIEIEDTCFKVNAKNMKGSRVWLSEKAVTGTENVIMAAVLTDGNTEIINAASEPHVQDLCNFLNKMGAKISGIGSDHLYIEGVNSLNGTEHTIMTDFMEVGTFIAAAAVTGGEITIENAIPEHMTQIIDEFAKLGVSVEIKGNDIIAKQGDMKIRSYLDGSMNKIECLPWPAFPADLLQFMIVVATQSQGRILIHDKLYEGRLFYTSELVKMGADIFMADPHRIVVNGKTALKGKVLTSPDIRAGMSLLIAALAAKGESVIERGEIIERGYENIQEKFLALGATIKRIE